MLCLTQEGAAYLDRNLTEWKKPYLMNEEGQEEEEGDEGDDAMEENDGDEDNERVDDEEEETDEEEDDEAPKLAKYSTMKETAEVHSVLDT